MTAGRLRRSAAALTASVLLMTACQTTGHDQPPGAVAGAATGAAAGLGAETGVRMASGGHTGNPLLGLVALPRKRPVAARMTPGLTASAAG